LGVEVVVLVLTMQPVMVIGHFSSGTNDTKQFNRYTLSFFGIGLILLILLVVSTAGVFAADTLLTQVSVDDWNRQLHFCSVGNLYAAVQSWSN